MKNNLCFVVCENVRQEFHSVLTSEEFEHVKYVPIPTQWGCSEISPDVSQQVLSQCDEAHHELVYLPTGSCLKSDPSEPHDIKPDPSIRFDECTHLLLDSEIIDGYISEGAFPVSPGWIQNWQYHLRQWIDDGGIGLSMFKRHIKKIVLLDTGQYEGSRQYLKSFSEYVQKPVEIIPVGLSFLKFRIQKEYLQWMLSREKHNFKNALNTASQQSSGYAMAFDLIGNLTSAMSEKRAIEKIFDLFVALFAPECIFYIPAEGDTQGYCLSYPDTRQPPVESFCKLTDMQAEYDLSADGRGFCLRLSYDDQTLGILEIKGIAFPQYRDRYLNVALAVKNVCSLAITNSRIYEKLTDSVEALRSALDDRRKAEKALRISEQNVNAIIQKIPDIVYRLDADGKINFISDSILKYGYTPDALIGRKILNFVHPEDRHKAVWRINERRTGKRSTVGLQLKLLFGSEAPVRDGATSGLPPSNFIFMVSAEGIYAPERDNLKKFIGTQGIARDITSVMKAADDKEKFANNIRHMEKMEAVGTLAGGLAHNFNNMLMGIQGHVSLMLMRTDQSQENYSHLKNMEDVIKSAADLSRQLLGFARKGKFHVSPADLNTLILNTTNLFGRPRKEIEIELNLTRDLWMAAVDRNQIEQVFLNLYINAWQAMPDGGRLSISTFNRDIDAKQAEHMRVKPGRFVLITVSDTGAGIPADILDRIFDPFFTTKGIGQGTGLGLASAYGIVENHAGQIDVHSQVGVGTTFSIYLPATDKQTERDRKKMSGVSVGHETILLVDDEPFVIDVASQMLKKLGYSVLTALDGHKAIQIYQEKRKMIDLVMLDILMSGISGTETYARLKKIDPEIKVLVCSGYSEKGQAAAILDQGCNGFIQKPFGLIDFSQKIRAVLDCQ